MMNQQRGNQFTPTTAPVLWGMAVLFLLAAGCSSKDERQAQVELESGQVVTPPPAPTPALLPPLEVSQEAPVLAEVFPRLSSGPLTHARLIALPEGVLLRTEGLVIREADIEAGLQDAPPAQREMLRQNGFMLLERLATGQLLEQEARHDLTAEGQDVAALSQEAVLQTWMGGLVSRVEVSTEDIQTFYEENRDLMGGAPLAQIKPQLEQHLLQQKQQEAIQAHIRALGERRTVVVDADWTAKQDAAARDNPVDRARDSGLPTMASFGADTCRPCQMMKPFRETVAKEYAGRVNVVYVHVNKDQMLASRYGVQSIPHTVFFGPNGDEMESRTGLMTLEQIETVLARLGVDRE